MRVFVAVATVFAANVLALLAPAEAQGAFADCVKTPDRSAIICRNGLVIYINGVPGAVESDGKPAWQPPEGWVRVGVLKPDPNPWGVCLTYQWVPPGSEPQYPPGTFDPVTDAPTCTPAAGSVARSPGEFAVLAWQRVALPAPDPEIAPGRAIVGKDAFLETNGNVRLSHREPTPLGELRIEATGRYHVDWGDGAKTGPHNVEGRSWPDGQIKHQYRDVGAYNVVVAEEWTATWQLGSEGGRLPDGRTTGRIDSFPVQQIQAVIR